MSTRTNITPPVAHLACSLVLPDDFNQIPIPEESHDFSQRHTLMPVGVFMAAYGAVLCTIAARPAGNESSLMEFVMFLCAQQPGFAIKKMMPEKKWNTTVVAVDATQPSDAGEMIVRTVFFEDGGSIYTLGIMAPTAIWPSVEPTLAAIADSFALATVQGPTLPVAPGQTPPPPAAFAVPPVAAAPAPEPAPADNTPALPDLSAYALADPAALDPDDAINARFRDAGVGLVPNTVHADPARACVVIGSGALRARVPIPAGWHAIDDGRRTLVFDRANAIQVNLTLIPVDGQSPADIFTAIIADLQQAQGETPAIEHRTFEVGGYNAMQVRNLVIDGESLQQGYLLRRHPAQENLALKVRITAAEENIARAMDLTGDMLSGIQWM